MSERDWTERALRPIDEVLPGIEILELDEGDQAIEALIIIKAVNPEHTRPLVYVRTTANLSDVEILGMLRATCLSHERYVVNAFWSDDD